MYGARSGTCGNRHPYVSANAVRASGGSCPTPTTAPGYASPNREIGGPAICVTEHVTL